MTFLFLYRLRKGNLNIMKDQKTLTDKLSIIFLSFFYVGYLPKAPGTFGSIASLPLLYALSFININIYYFILILVISTILTCLITDSIQKKMSLHDPQWIVADEVLGMLTTWIFIYPSLSFYDSIAILILFRFFDIVKIWPASYFDKMHHGSGTILDDIISGIYAGLALLLGKYCLNLV